MISKVVKRTGEIEVFNPDKIIRAVCLSASRTKKELSEDEKTTIVVDTILDLEKRGFTDSVKIDDIHLSVENVLWDMDRELYQEYRSYNNYKKRFNHSFNNLLRGSRHIIFDGDKENANKDSCINSTKMTLTAELVGKELYLEYEIPRHLADAHRNLDFYIHDAGHRWYNMINCCLLDVANILKDGFKLNGKKIKEPNSLYKAIDLLNDIIFVASSQQYGNQV